MERLLFALGAGSYAAHSICLTGDPWIIGLYVFHDLLTFASYTVIATLLMVTRGALAGPGWLGFVVFIYLCGLTHLTSTLVIFDGVYRLDVIVKMATGWASFIVAFLNCVEFRKWLYLQRLLRRSSAESAASPPPASS